MGSLVIDDSSGTGEGDGGPSVELASVAASIPDTGSPGLFDQVERIGFSCNGGAISAWLEVLPDTGSGFMITVWCSDGTNTISATAPMFIGAMPLNVQLVLTNDDLGDPILEPTRSFLQANYSDFLGGSGFVNLEPTTPTSSFPFEFQFPALTAPFNPFAGGPGALFDSFGGGDAFEAVLDHFLRPNGVLGFAETGQLWTAVSPIGVPGSPTSGAIVSHVAVFGGLGDDRNATLLASAEGSQYGPIGTGAGR